MHLIKYSIIFHGEYSRVSISAEHGPMGVIDAIRSAAALARTNLFNPIHTAFPHLLVNYYYAGACCLLAASIATGTKIAVHKDLQMAPATLTTYHQFRTDVEADALRPGHRKR